MMNADLGSVPVSQGVRGNALTMTTSTNTMTDKCHYWIWPDDWTWAWPDIERRRAHSVPMSGAEPSPQGRVEGALNDLAAATDALVHSAQELGLPLTREQVVQAIVTRVEQRLRG